MVKGLIPTLKEQNRYVVFEILSSEKFDYSAINEALEKSFKAFLGTLYYARANPMLIRNKWDQSSQKGVFKVNSKYLDHAKASLTLVRKINNKEVCIRSTITSGILNKAC